MTINPNELGYGLEKASSISLHQLGAMARANAALHAHNSKEFREWIALSARYERQARWANKHAREIHGFEGDDS